MEKQFNKVLVTGANGLLASNIISELLRNQYEVRGLLRDKKKYTATTGAGLELVEGDITNPGIIQQNLQNCDRVIHVAALTAHDLTKYEPYKKVNADAAEMLIKMCIKEGVHKFVFVSSANTFGYGTRHNPGNEETPIRPPFSNSFYAQSKLEGQQRVMKYAGQTDVVCVNPTFMLGPYDGKPGSGQIILMGYNKKIIFCPPGGKNFVNAVDAAKGVVAAMEKGKSGEAYLLAGENLTYRDFFQKLSLITNNKAVYITLPSPILKLVGFFGTLLQKTGIKTQLSLTNMKILCVKNFYSNQKASTELAIEFMPVDRGIKEAIEWFRENGMIKK